MNRNQIGLWLAYGLLVLVTGWSAYQTQETLERQEDLVCFLGELEVADGLSVFEVFGEQEGVDPERLEQVISNLDAVSTLLIDECRIFQTIEERIEEDVD